MRYIWTSLAGMGRNERVETNFIPINLDAAEIELLTSRIFITTREL